MWDILSSFEFWFGASVLCTYQCAKFNELSSPDQAIPNLHAHDFAGRFTFTGALAAFLVATFVVYFVACQASPEIIKTVGRFYGINVNYDLENYGGSIPVYIAAAFMGVTQSAIPIFSRFADKQRSIFHALMGIPRIVTASSGSFTTQILARASTKNELGREVQDLIGDAWLKKLDAYADVEFYRQQLKRLNLDDESEVRELLRGSRRELKNVLGQLIYAAALATARESGPKFLVSLAADLRVLRKVDTLPTRKILGTGMIFLIGAAMLWSVIPMLDSMAGRFLLGPSATDLWPATLDFSVPYVFSQVGPILVATVVALAAWSRIRRETAGPPVGRGSMLSTLAANFDRHAGVIAFIFVTIALYDVLQALFDYGRFDNKTAETLLNFVKENALFFFLHALPSVVVCFSVLFYMDDHVRSAKGKATLALTMLAIGSALAALIYAAMRVKYQFKEGIGGVDFIVLVVGLNVSAAFLALLGSAFYGWRPDGREPELTSPAPAVSVDGIGSPVPVGA